MCDDWWPILMVPCLGCQWSWPLGGTGGRQSWGMICTVAPLGSYDGIPLPFISRLWCLRPASIHPLRSCNPSSILDILVYFWKLSCPKCVLLHTPRLHIWSLVEEDFVVCIWLWCWCCRVSVGWLKILGGFDQMMRGAWVCKHFMR